MPVGEANQEKTHDAYSFCWSKPLGSQGTTDCNACIRRSGGFTRLTYNLSVLILGCLRQVTIDDEHPTVDLVDGRRIVIPLAWYPRLVHGSQQERQNWQLLGDGYAIEWPDLDEHIGIEGLLAGRCSGESTESFERWLASRRTQARQEG